MKKGKVLPGKFEDRGRYYKCPNCGFTIDSQRDVRDDKWHVEYTFGNNSAIETEADYELESENNASILVEGSVYEPVVTGGCPFCGLGAWR